MMASQEDAIARQWLWYKDDLKHLSVWLLGAGVGATGTEADEEFDFLFDIVMIKREMEENNES